MGNCVSSVFSRETRRPLRRPVRLIYQEAMAVSPAFDSMTGDYLGAQITTTLVSREVTQVFQPALGYPASSSSLSESSSIYLEPIELLEEVKAYLETEL